MKQSLFESRHQLQWQAFANHLQQLEQGKATASELADFPQQYRRLCQHLALAQERGYSSYLVDPLQQLALRGHQQLYRHRSQLTANVLGFVLADFPRLVREQWRFVLIASLLFFGSLVGIAFQTFAAGLLFGLGSVFFLIFNGLVIGAVSGHLTEIGYGQTFWSFVIGHGAFELTAIALAGAAGLQLGWALIAPGQLTRGESLRLAARKSVQMLCGVMIFLLIAAFIEAYWSSTTLIAPWVKYLVGAALWMLVTAYLGLAGRTRHAPK